MPPLDSAASDFFSEHTLVKLVQMENFVGWCYEMSYSSVKVMVNDKWKSNANGVPHNCFLIATSLNPDNFSASTEEDKEVILLRVTGTSSLPQDEDLIEAKIDYFQRHTSPVDDDAEYDDITRDKMQYHGLECRILGTFYKDDENLKMGSDIESFSSASRMNVYRPTGDALEIIVNYVDPIRKRAAIQETDIIESDEGLNPFPIGSVRYTSTERRHRGDSDEVPVFIQPSDLLSRRTAVLGMTRTGKSNMIKQLVSVVKEVSDSKDVDIGQIIYDVNGEYANPNEQDEESLPDLYPDEVVRYSLRPPGNSDFRELRTNFYEQIREGHSLICEELERSGEDSSGYQISFMELTFEEPEDEYTSEYGRWARRTGAYIAVLRKAGFAPPDNFNFEFQANQSVRDAVNQELPGSTTLNPSSGLSPDQAVQWFEALKTANETHDLTSSNSDRDWVDDDLETLLTMLTQEDPDGRGVRGYSILAPARKYHSPVRTEYVAENIYDHLRNGRIVILDLSVGSPRIRDRISEDIANTIFRNSMEYFVEGESPPNITVYTEESHNLIGKDLDLDETWPRIAKEGAKYNIGMVYATQEVSSVHPNILSNTENWFVTHLNNESEIKVLSDFYDFDDFSESLMRAQDVGFARVKMLSGPFVVPTQIDKFGSDQNDS